MCDVCRVSRHLLSLAGREASLVDYFYTLLITFEVLIISLSLINLLRSKFIIFACCASDLHL